MGWGIWTNRLKKTTQCDINLLHGATWGRKRKAGKLLKITGTNGEKERLKVRGRLTDQTRIAGIPRHWLPCCLFGQCKVLWALGLFRAPCCPGTEECILSCRKHAFRRHLFPVSITHSVEISAEGLGKYLSSLDSAQPRWNRRHLQVWVRAETGQLCQERERCSCNPTLKEHLLLSCQINVILWIMNKEGWARARGPTQRYCTAGPECWEPHRHLLN